MYRNGQDRAEAVSGIGSLPLRPPGNIHIYLFICSALVTMLKLTHSWLCSPPTATYRLTYVFTYVFAHICSCTDTDTRLGVTSAHRTAHTDMAAGPGRASTVLRATQAGTHTGTTAFSRSATHCSQTVGSH